MKKATQLKVSSFSMDPVTQYMNEVGSVSLLSRTEETEAMKQIERLESEYVMHMLSLKGFGRNALYQLQKMVKDSPDGRTFPDGVDVFLSTVKKMSRSPSQEMIHTFMRSIRFTDVGRTWIQLIHDRAHNSELAGDRVEWLNKVKDLYNKQLQAKNEFAEANLRFVVSIARRYFRPSKSLSFGDVVQEGNLGLMKAVERFDSERGYKFSTYAMWWIRQNIQRAIAEKELLVRIPCHMVDGIHRINRLEGKLQLAGIDLSDPANVKEIARRVKMTESKTQMALANRNNYMLSLDVPLGEDEEGGGTWVDTIRDETGDPLDHFTQSQMKYDMQSLLDQLTPIEKKIIIWRFGLSPEGDTTNKTENDGMTLADIGIRFSLTRERIRQIEAQALKKLRKKSSDWSPRG